MACCTCVYGYNEICHKETSEKVAAVTVDCVLFHLAAAVATAVSVVLLLVRLLACALYSYCSIERPMPFLPVTESRIEWLTLLPILGPTVVASVIYCRAKKEGYGCLDSLVCAMQSPWMLIDSICKNRTEPVVVRI